MQARRSERLGFERGRGGGLVGIGRKLRELELGVGKIDVHQVTGENIRADQAFVANHGAAIDHVHVAPLKFQVADLNGIGKAQVAGRSAFVADPLRFNLENFFDAGLLRDFLVDQDSTGAGIEH